MQAEEKAPSGKKKRDDADLLAQVCTLPLHVYIFSLSLQPAPFVHSYVVEMNLDMAPCVHGAVLSLALCKPAIRKSAVVGSWAIALASKKVFGVEGLIAFLFQVTATVALPDYHRDADRPDKIYRVVEGKLIHKGETSFHNIGPNRGTFQARDKQGRVLLSTCFVKFDLSNPLPLSEDLCPLLHQHIGQKKTQLTPELNADLLRLVEEAHTGDLPGVSAVSFLPAVVQFHQHQPSVSSLCSFFFSVALSENLF
jgi:hypothetical protein